MAADFGSVVLYLLRVLTDVFRVGRFQCSLYPMLTSSVNSDDGLIRGIELKSGKVMTTLQGHESAVRSLWSGIIDNQEVLISGSFDKSVTKWIVPT